MKHKLLNLYYFATDDLITHVAFVLYEHSGTEEEMCHFLLSKVGLDLSDANFGDIPQEIKDKENGVSLAKINAMMRTDNLTLIFSDVLAPYNLGDDCLHLITPIQNGKIMNQHRLDFEPLRQHHIDKFSGYEFSNHNDYLSKYYVGNTFDMAQLLKDDHFEPIHYLFNNKHYLSCIKLLFSFIDTIAGLILVSTITLQNGLTPMQIYLLWKLLLMSFGNSAIH